MVYPTDGDLTAPMFSNEGGRISLTHTIIGPSDTYISDTRDKETKTLKGWRSIRVMRMYVNDPPAQQK